jgi:LuxR family maltose regulon positive regulatory protein
MPTPIGTATEPGHRLARPDLLGLLDRSRDYALTLLLAPPGFGKSTLLQQWRNLHNSRHMVLMALDPRDADPVHFFTHLTDALREAVPDFDTASYTPLSADIHVPAYTVAETLLQALEAVNNELFIVLDDFHKASHPMVQNVMSILLEHLPFHIHIILASRTHPDFSLSRLKLADRLLLIDSHDLRLSAQQVHELARGMGLSAPDEDHINRLLHQAEGWLAGVKIALLACSRTGHTAIESFGGSQPELVDYFAHAVLRELPEEQRIFLMHTALMDHFDAALCDNALGRNDSARMINRLTAQSLFLQPIDQMPNWYRYHPLFQDFLRNRMHIEHADQLPILHEAIAHAWLQRGDNEIALSHAEKTNRPDFYLSILRIACERWSHKGDSSSVIRWLDPLEDDVILTDRDLSVSLISALLLSRRFNQARYYMDASAKITENNPIDESTRVFFELMLQLFQHDTDFRLNADQAVLIRSSQHHDIRAFSLAMLAYHHLMHGDFNSTLHYAEQGKVVLEQLGYDCLASYADLILVLCDRNTGRMLQAMQNAEIHLQRQQHQPYTPPWINAATAAAIVRYEQNRTQESMSLLEELVPVVNSSCATEIIVYTYLTLSRLLSQKNERTRASRLLSQLSRILQIGNYDRFFSQVVHEELLQANAYNDMDTMNRIAETHQLESRFNNGTWRRTRAYDEAWERYGLATSLWLTAHQRYEEAERTLEVILVALKKSGANYRAVVIEANLVLIRHLMGDDNVALHRLKRLIDHYSLICINRTVFDETPGLARFLKRCHDVGNLSLPTIYTDMFRDVLESEPTPVSEPRDEALLLTAKEQEVLALLCNGLSNNEISNRIGVALSTTKWHLKNIFAKMGVTSRTAAILQASQQNSTLRAEVVMTTSSLATTLANLPITGLI